MNTRKNILNLLIAIASIVLSSTCFAYGNMHIVFKNYDSKTHATTSYRVAVVKGPQSRSGHLHGPNGEDKPFMITPSDTSIDTTLTHHFPSGGNIYITVTDESTNNTCELQADYNMIESHNYLDRVSPKINCGFLHVHHDKYVELGKNA